MVVLIRRENIDADVAMDWKLQPTAGTILVEREKKS
jgi:hypothetical protein